MMAYILTVDVPLHSILDHVTVAQSEVMSSIDKLKGNSSAGPDGFPPAMCDKHFMKIHA